MVSVNYIAPDGCEATAACTFTIDVDTDAQTASFSIDGFDFGTVSGGDYSGDVALVFTDPFNSVSGNADLGFGVFDNLTVTQVPEPSTSLLLLVGCCCVLRHRSSRK